jgi:hypothetical protein
MNPAADTLAMASTEVNIGALEIGQALTVKWRVNFLEFNYLKLIIT